jgi:hypothetical protein
MGDTCSAHGKMRMRKKNCLENLKERCYSEDLGVHNYMGR